MRLDQAIEVLNSTIPPSNDKMVDMQHLPIAQAWETIKAFISDFEWRDAAVEVPVDSEEIVIALATGKPTENITLKDAVVFATFDMKEDEWCCEEYPEWNKPHITRWMPIPNMPEARENS